MFLRHASGSGEVNAGHAAEHAQPALRHIMSTEPFGKSKAAGFESEYPSSGPLGVWITPTSSHGPRALPFDFQSTVGAMKFGEP